MKKIILSGLLLASSIFAAQAQADSPNSVAYMITYDNASAVYTAWVVPNYNTPNQYNPETEEKAVTAQFSIKVSKGFELSDVKVNQGKGNWEKTPLKIGSQPFFLTAGADPNYEYYIIGKTPEETNLGVFKANEPVALFTFKGSIANSDKVAILEKNDPFVPLAKDIFALNVDPSFYSRSGQMPKVDAKPLEQFAKGITLNELTKQAAIDAGIDPNFKADPNNSNNVLAYPNPMASTDKDLNLKVFSNSNNANAQISIMDVSGHILKTETMNATTGFNNTKLNLANLPSGVYYVKTNIGGEEISKKIIK